MSQPSVLRREEPDSDPIALLISALIDSGHYDPGAHGIPDSAINHHRGVHDFAVQYQQVTGEAPSIAEVLRRYPTFPYVATLTTDEAKLRWAVDRMHLFRRLRHYNQVVTDAARSLTRDQPDMAEHLLRKGLLEAPATRNQWVSAMDPELDESLEAEGWPVPDPTLQRLTGGIHPGEIWYIGASTGIGKSIELCRMAVELTSKGVPVDIFSLEMLSAKLKKRIWRIMDVYGLDVEARRAFFRQWEQAGKQIIKIHDRSKSPCTLTSIQSEAEPGKVLMLDYVGLMRTVGGSRAASSHEFASEISHDLAEIARQNQCGMIVAAQLNREAEESTKHSTSEFAQSLDYGRDADVVVFLRGHRHSKVRLKQLVKNRDGISGVDWYTHYQVAENCYEELSPDRARSIIAAEQAQRLNLI